MNSKVKRKGKRKMWIIILIILGVFGAVCVGGILATGPGRREIKELTFTDVNFNKLRDGTYLGEYIGKKDHFRDTKLQVIISSGRISDIKILKGAIDKDGKPAELTGGLSMKDLFDNVKKSQSFEVDTISGATLSSKAHLKALEAALKQAEVK